MANDRGRALVVLIVLLLTLFLTAGNLFFHLLSLVGPNLPSNTGMIGSLSEAYARQPYAVLFLGIAPILTGILIACLVGLREGMPRTETAPDTAGSRAVDAPASGSALRLLTLLQQEGRLIDFLEEDIEAYSDAQVGAAARTIHSGCRKALHDRMQIERIYADEDGAAIEVAAGFDPSELRLTGNVHGEPPFKGTLQHGGWRASEVNLPETARGIDPTILAPAEVEIG